MPTTRTLRSFGLSVGTVWGLIGVIPTLLRREDPRWWALALAVLLIGPALTWPRALRPLYTGWMAIGGVLGWINTRILLSALFYTLFPLVAAFLRLSGKDPMRRRLEPDASTYRMPRQPRPATHMKNQF
jgi:hypothetical protein